MPLIIVFRQHNDTPLVKMAVAACAATGALPLTLEGRP
jgi:hypothetical protein